MRPEDASERLWRGELGEAYTQEHLAARRGRRATSPSAPVFAEAVPLPLPGSERAVWRLALLCLCLNACRGKSATIEQLHLLMWATRDDANWNQFRAAWSSERLSDPLRAWDPQLDELLRVARAAGLVSQSSTGRQKLSDSGRRLVHEMISMNEVPLREEIERLATLGTLSEAELWRRMGSVGTRGGAT
jgi:hypothetical protein